MNRARCLFRNVEILGSVCARPLCRPPSFNLQQTLSPCGQRYMLRSQVPLGSLCREYSPLSAHSVREQPLYTVHCKSRMNSKNAIAIWRWTVTRPTERKSRWVSYGVLCRVCTEYGQLSMRTNSPLLATSLVSKRPSVGRQQDPRQLDIARLSPPPVLFLSLFALLPSFR